MLHYYIMANEKIPEIEIHHFLVIPTCEPLKYNMDYPIRYLLHQSVWGNPQEYKGLMPFHLIYQGTNILKDDF